MTIETIVYSVLVAIVVCMFVYVKYSNDRLEEDEKFIDEVEEKLCKMKKQSDYVVHCMKQMK